jgi:hypothetical protein
MSIVSIGSYIENNQTAVTSSTAKLVAQQVFVGDQNGGGQVNVSVDKNRNNGVFIGIDGHKN